MRRSPKLDFTKREIDFPNVGVFALSAVSQAVMPALALLGLKHALLNAEDLQTTYADLVGGVMKYRSSPSARIDPWHEAMALACADQHATQEALPKSKPSVIAGLAASYLPDMRAHVAALPKETHKAMKAHPAVIQHYNRITGVAAELQSPLAIAGYQPRQADLVLGEAMAPETVELVDAA